MVFNVVRSVVVVVGYTAVLVVFFAIVLKDLVVLLTSELMVFITGLEVLSIVLDISVQLGVHKRKRNSVRMTAPSGSLSLEARRGPLH